MSAFRVLIETDNDAFQPDAKPEVARILRQIADTLGGDDYYTMPLVLRDVNGNTVGEARFGRPHAPIGINTHKA